MALTYWLRLAAGGPRRAQTSRLTRGRARAVKRGERREPKVLGKQGPGLLLIISRICRTVGTRAGGVAWGVGPRSGRRPEWAGVQHRRLPKGFACRRPDGAGGWVWNLDGV